MTDVSTLFDIELIGQGKLHTSQESTHGRHTRVIGLTASPLQEDQLLAKAAGMDGVLVKPIDDRALRSLFY